MDFSEDKFPLGAVRASVVGVFSALLYLTTCCTCMCTKGVLAGLMLILISGRRPYWIYIIFKTIKRDYTFMSRLFKMRYILWKYDKKNMTVAKVFKDLVVKHPNKIVFHTDKKSWTFKELWELSQRSAHLFKKHGLKRNDVVGLMLSNGGGAELPGLWLGAATLGAPAALLPPQLRGTALIHVITTAKTNMIVYTDDLSDAIAEIRDNPEMKDKIFFQYNLYEDRAMLKDAKPFAELVKTMPTTPMEDEIAKGNFGDKFIYIYTSGTTGLPKAAVIKNVRYFMVSVGFYQVGALRDDDVLYTALPLHHTAGAMIGVGQAIVNGMTVVLRGKFSASNFWKDCIKYQCTIAQYIGEICRFLLSNAEKSGVPDPAGPHKVRLMIGNGLRPNIWKKFQDTFKIAYIYELYGATEGNTNMLNISKQQGSVGFVPRILSFISPLILIKCDDITGEPIRNKDGLCIPCKPGEPGLMLGVLDPKDRIYSFTGYVDKEATKKKILSNVLKPNDLYFNSGDVLVMDHFGFFYFKDRTGDTFRWRGENVSTAEVESIISQSIGLTDTTVFGVQIPNVEGRAGMAAIVDPNNKLDLDVLRDKLKSALPPYAHPLFIRIIPQLEVTSTFKIVKRHLQADGFDISKFKDPTYFLDQKSLKYVPLTKEIYDDIITGKIRL